jgi:hypothetical protein
LNEIKAVPRNRKLPRLTPNTVTRLRKGNRKARKPVQMCTGPLAFVGLLFIDVLVGYSCP